VVFGDLDPELDGLPFGIPAGVLGKVKNMGRLRLCSGLQAECLAADPRYSLAL
jgi:hypothetical protein